MGKLTTVKKLVETARGRMREDHFKMFVDIKVSRDFGGNNALLYACNSSSSEQCEVIEYLIKEVGASVNVMNDYFVNCLLIATKKQQINVMTMLLTCGVNLAFVDKNGFNALHIASSAGFSEIVKMILHYQAKMKKAHNKLELSRQP